jgi:transcriptional regulator with XRE-family HTH domain
MNDLKTTNVQQVSVYTKLPIPPEKEFFAPRLKRLREVTKRMKQLEFAQAVGFECGETISKYENPKRHDFPNQEKLERIARFCGCTVDYLLGKTDRQTPMPSPPSSAASMAASVFVDRLFSSAKESTMREVIKYPEKGFIIPAKEQFAESLRTLRENTVIGTKRMTQNWLASIIGGSCSHPMTISRFENPERFNFPTEETLNAICKYFGTTVEEMTGYTVEEIAEQRRECRKLNIQAGYEESEFAGKEESFSNTCQVDYEQGAEKEVETLTLLDNPAVRTVVLQILENQKAIMQAIGYASGVGQGQCRTALGNTDKLLESIFNRRTAKITQEVLYG